MKRTKLSTLLCTVILSGFLLGIHNGRVALWKDQDPQPVRVFPYFAAALPEPLQRALCQGIPLESMDDLEDLMEKYLP